MVSSFDLDRRQECLFTCEYESDPIGREKVDRAGEREGNQMSHALEKEGMRREPSGGVSHSDRRKGTII